MKFLELLEKTEKISHKTNHQYLYHLTDNYGLGMSVAHDLLQPKGSYAGISTTYRKLTTSIYGYQAYNYKFILDGKKLAQKYGVFEYKHFAREVGSNRKIDLDEAEIRINTKTISPLSDYLQGIVLISPTPYTELQILFYADVNIDHQWGRNDNDTTIPAITALNNTKVPLYWQINNEFVPLNEKDHQYLIDIETAMNEIDKNKKGSKRNERHFDILEKLMDKYDIHYEDLIDGKKPLDKIMIYRKRMVPRIVRELNNFYDTTPMKDMKPNDMKKLMVHFMQIMKFGNNATSMIVGALESKGFFHPTTEPFKWTIVIGDLVEDKDIDSCIRHINDIDLNHWAVERYEQGNYFKHANTGMSIDDE